MSSIHILLGHTLMVHLKGILGGSRGILYLSSNNNTAFEFGIGHETNNYFELMAFKLTLRLAQEYGVTQLQIF
jgi:ribonuclease HI